VLKLGAVEGVICDGALRSDLRLDEIHGGEARSPQQQTASSSQNDVCFMRNGCSELIVSLHAILPKNRIAFCAAGTFVARSLPRDRLAPPGRPKIQARRC